MNHLNKLCDFLGNAAIHSYKVLTTKKQKKEVVTEPTEEKYPIHISQEIKPIELYEYIEKTSALEPSKYSINTRVRCGIIEGVIIDVYNTDHPYRIRWENDLICSYDKNWLDTQVEVISNE